MDIKIEPNLDPNSLNNEDEHKFQYANCDLLVLPNQAIKQEDYDCGFVNIPGRQDMHNIKQETNQAHPEVIMNINNHSESAGLQIIIDPKNKEKKHYKCSICNNLFSYRRALICHLRTHTGEKPYSCPLCEYKSTQKVNLTCHIRRNHTGEKPYTCDFCDFKSATKYQLICHMRIHTGEKPFSCFFCKYRCAHKVDMIRHMRTHTGEKPFSCTFCDHKCADKRDLTHHVRIHTGEKPYVCNFCDYKCIKKSYLNAHTKVHTGEKPFCCHLCDYKCSRKAVLNRHLKTHAEGKRVKKIRSGKGHEVKESEESLIEGRVDDDDKQLENIKFEECIVKEEKIDMQYS